MVHWYSETCKALPVSKASAITECISTLSNAAFNYKAASVDHNNVLIMQRIQITNKHFLVALCAARRILCLVFDA